MTVITGRKSNLGLLFSTPILALSFVVAFLVSCSVTGPLRVDPKAKGYSFGSLSSLWQPQELDTTADYVYTNARSGAFIAVNSTCNRYPDSSLESLTNQLQSPVQDAQVTMQEARTLDGREALYTRVDGKLDGVPIETYFVVVRKNECIFDFTLQSLDHIRTQDEHDFLGLVQQFRYGILSTVNKKGS